MRKSRIFAAGFAVLLGLSGSSAAAGGDEPPADSFTFPDLEVCLSFALTRQALEGDFDGETFFQGAGLLLLVPDIEPGFGFGGALSAKRRLGRGDGNALGAEIYVIRSVHEGSWMEAPGRGVLWDVGAGLSWHLFAQSRVQPYIKGVYAFTGFDFDLDDAPDLETCSFAGTKWAFGAGVSLYLTQQWILDLGVMRNRHRFGAPADIRSIVLDPPMGSGTFDLEGRITFRF